MFEDFAIMYYAPFLISTGSTMSLLPGLAAHVSISLDSTASPQDMLTRSAAPAALCVLLDSDERPEC